jgi:hypothetical protein
MEAKNNIKLGRLAGLNLSADTSAILGSLLLWVVLSLIAFFLLSRTLLVAIVAGLIAVVLHWIGEIWHQFGHAWAARRSGHPMTGIRMWGVLSSSIYPPDEGELPNSIHIQRALGGPIISLILAVVVVIPLLFLPTGSTAWWLALFLLADNLLVFGLGALLPLGFTDGSTLLRILSKSPNESRL